MYHSYFGKLGQLRFPKPEDYYRFLGYLAHANCRWYLSQSAQQNRPFCALDSLFLLQLF